MVRIGVARIIGVVRIGVVNFGNPMLSLCPNVNGRDDSGCSVSA